MKTPVKCISLLLFVISASAFAVPNPAAVFCENEAKGKTETLDGQNGQTSLCVFADGGSIEQWTLYRAKKLQKKQIAVEKFKTSTGAVPRVMPRPGHSVPSAAQIVCQQKTGSYISYTRATNGELTKLCEFTDGSAINGSTLMHGPKHAMGKALMRVLKKKFSAPNAE